MTDIDDWVLWLICYNWYVYDAWNINHMIKTLWLIFMSCYDVYDMWHAMYRCFVSFVRVVPYGCPSGSPPIYACVTSF